MWPTLLPKLGSAVTARSKEAIGGFNKAFGQQTGFATRPIKGNTNAANLTRRRRRGARPTTETGILSAEICVICGQIYPVR